MIKFNKRSQAWGIDLTVGIIIFSIGLLVFLIYTLNNSGEIKEKFDTLNNQGDNIINTILSEGYPINWNTTTVTKIGIVDNGKINDTKLFNFYTLSKNDYPRTRILFDTSYNYYFFMNSNMTLDGTEVSGIGDPTFDPSNIEVLNLIKITRFGIYKDKPTTFYLYIWED